MTETILRTKALKLLRGRWLHGAGLFMLAIAAVAAVALTSWRRHAEAKEARALAAAARQGAKVVVTRARPAAATRSFVLQGDVRAFRQATLYAKVSGYLKNLRVDRGDIVATSDILGIIESPETAQQETSARAALLLRQQTATRVGRLIPSGVVSQQEMDNAAGSLAMARAESARIRALRGYEVLRAPFAGRITARYVDPGALLSAATGATQSAQPVLEVSDTRHVRIFIYPGQNDSTRLNEHDRVKFWTDAEPAKMRQAEITRTAHSLDPRTRTMLAEIDVDNEDESLHPGSYVHVQVTVPTSGGVTVPADALFIRSGKPHLAVVDEARVRFTPVEVADDDGTLVRISSGLTVGAAVILHPGDDVVDGETVSAVARKEDK